MKKIHISLTVVISALVIFACTHFSGCDKRKTIDPTPGMDIAKQYWIRVLLFDNIRKCTINNGSKSAFEDGNLSKPISLPALNMYNITVFRDSLAILNKPIGTDITIMPEDGKALIVNGKQYRGKVRLVLNEDLSSFDVINDLPIEAYLDGVVGAEMPSYWEAEALKAQAIAARTYSLFHKQKYGQKRQWDVTRTQATQVYGGIAAETVTVRRAVSDTYGMVLTCDYADGNMRIFPAYYSSVCGGHTEDNGNVFGYDQYSALSGVKCDYCRKIARKNVYSWDEVTISKEVVTANLLSRYPTLSKLGKIEAIEIRRSGYIGRITSVRLVGLTGENDTIRGEDLRIAIDSTGSKLKSAVFKIETSDDSFRFYGGRGYGHGVGLCQCGAEGMARKGKNYEDILSHYYPGSKLYNLDYTK